MTRCNTDVPFLPDPDETTSSEEKTTTSTSTTIDQGTTPAPGKAAYHSSASIWGLFITLVIVMAWM